MDEQIITNGICYNWFDGCLACKPSIFQPIFSSYQFIFHFDGLLCIITELLVLLPTFFRFYGFGVQQKLAKFYNNSRYQLIIFLFLFSLSAVLCSDFQIFLPQPPACVTWDGLNYEPIRPNYLSPSLTIVLITIIICFIFTISIFTSAIWLIYIVILTFIYLFAIISAILSGTQTINQVLLSMALGFWLFYLYRFLPPIFIPVSSTLFLVCSMILFIYEIIDKGRKDDFVKLTVVHGLRGCILLIFSIYLLIRHSKSNSNFNWFKISWSKGYNPDGTTIGGAVVPSVVDVGTGDLFGNRLKKDMIDSFLLFVAVLLINEFVSEFFDYAMFSTE